MARQVFSLKIHKSTEDACPSPTTGSPFPVSSPEGKGHDYRDTAIRKSLPPPTPLRMARGVIAEMPM